MTPADIVSILCIAALLLGAIFIPFWVLNDELDERDRVGRWAPKPPREQP